METGVDSVDRMLGHYLSWPRHFVRGLERGRSLSLEPSGRIVVCGMGTSGFSGEFARAMLQSRGRDIYVSVVRWIDPGPVGEGDVVVAVSYSGRTAETLECAKKALSRGARLVAVTSGGELSKLAPSVVRLDPGRPQRTGLAEMVGALIGLLDPEGDWSSVVEALSLGITESVSGIAETIASSRIGVVAGCGLLGVAAQRWRSELAENTKMLVKAEVYPESGHNDLVAYQEEVGCRTFFLALRDKEDSFCNSIIDVVARIYSRRGNVVILEPEGRDQAARILRAAQLAGLVSVLTAYKKGVDPEATPILHEYRQAIRRLHGLS